MSASQDRTSQSGGASEAAFHCTAIALSPDGLSCSLGGNDGDFRIFGTRLWRPLACHPGRGAPVTAMAFSADSLHIGYCDAQGNVTVRRRREWLSVLELSDAPCPALTCSFHPLTASFVWGAGNEVCKVSLTGGQRAVLAHCDRPVRTLGFSPDGRCLLIGDHAGALVVLDASTDVEQARFAVHRGAVYSVAIDPAGQLFASTGRDGNVTLWRVDGLCPVWCNQDHDCPVLSLMFWRAGGALISASANGTIRAMRLDDGVTVQRLPGDGVGIRQLSLEPFSNRLFAIADAAGVRCWSLSSRDPWISPCRDCCDRQ
jgi:WD40 repeat protein